MFFYKFSSRERSNNTHISTLREEFSADAKNRDPCDPHLQDIVNKAVETPSPKSYRDPK